VEIVYLRDGKEQRASLTPSEREPVQPRATELKAWGITVRNLTKLAALELKRDNNSGVLVTTVRPGGPSGTARPPLQPRDVITAVNGQSITNVAQLSALTDALIKDKTSPAPVMADFERKTEHLLTVVKLALKELDDPGNEVKKAWLPVALQALTRDVAEQMGEPDLTGVRVTQVYTNRSAALAGIRVGDIITALDGERVTARQPGDEETFTAAIRQYRIGDSAELTLQRGKEQLKLSVPLERAPELEREMNKYTDTLLEFGARNLAFADLAKEDLPAGQTGALVIDVTRGGWASLARLSTGDIITTVNDAPVTDVTTLEKTLTDLAKTQPATIVLRVLRGIHTVFVEIEPKWKGATNN
jgi:serine protease Do